MRDLAKDLELCDRATPGPWPVRTDSINFIRGIDEKWIEYMATGPYHEAPRGTSYSAREQQQRAQEQAKKDAEFVAEARDGWPEAIRRAMNAEVESKKLSGLLDRILCVCAEANLAADSFSESDCRALLRRIDEVWREVQLALQEDEEVDKDV